jgi:hypothetical protein
MDEVIAGLVRSGPTAEELDRARRVEIAGKIRATEAVGGFGGKAVTLAEGELYADDAALYRKRLAAWAALTGDSVEPLIFSDRTGAAQPLAPPAKASRGRPRLGVSAREVTLLPRHWEWLSGQPGGASAALRRLVEAAARAPESPEAARRRAADAACAVLSALAGDAPGAEAAVRALYAGDGATFTDHTAAWPNDIRDYLARLAAPAFSAPSAPPA